MTKHIAVLAFLLISSVPAGVYAGEVLGKHVDVILGVHEQWESNIFLEEDSEEDDFVTVVNPDAVFHVSGDEGYLEAEWIGRYGYYAEADEFTMSNYFYGIGFLTPNDRWALGSRASYERTDESDVSTFFGDRILQLGFDVASVGPQVKYQLSDRWTALLGYQFDTINVDDPSLDDHVDRDGHGMSAQLEYEFNPRLFVLGGYAFKDTSFDESALKDSFSNLVSAGVRKKFPSLFNADVKLIYHEKDFETSRDDENLDVEGTLSTTFSRYTTMSLSANRSLQESSRSEFTQYTSTRLTLSLQHYLTAKTAVWVRTAYEHQSFRSRDIMAGVVSGGLDADIYSASAGVRRSLLDWLSFEAAYEFQERDSDFIFEDLQNHIVRTGLKAYF